MKNFSSLFVSLYSLLVLFSCSNADDGLFTAPESMEVPRLIVDIEKPIFASTTRADASGWEDGDKLYLRFITSIGVVTSEAIYDSANSEWTISEELVLDLMVERKLELLYFDGPIMRTNNTLTLAPNTGVYIDTNGTYIKEYSKGNSFIVKIKGHLAPNTGRIRFKGEAGRTVRFSGLKHQSSYDLETGLFTTTDGAETTVAADGYTPYSYCLFSSDDQTLSFSEVLKDGVIKYFCTYTANYKGTNILAVGKSGWINIPTIANHEGWVFTSKPTEADGIKNNHEYVDLGLTSGLKWATCNVGADKPEAYGNYFAWGETKTKSDYSSSSCTSYGKTNAQLQSMGIIGTDGNLTPAHDAATANWGGTWRMPTLDEIKELFNNCTATWTTLNGVNGHKVTGPNGNSIFLSAAGYRNGSSLGNAGTLGLYWSSTPYLSNSNDACNLYFISSNFDWVTYNRYYGHPVRPVLE